MLDDPRLHGIPDYMIDGLMLYIKKGIEPGSFLQAVLSNDLRGACMAADLTNRFQLFFYIQYLYNEAPSPCYGSPDNYLMWVENGGMEGLEEAS